MCVDNVKVYGLEDSLRRAKFPMLTDTTKASYELTDAIKVLARSKMGEGHDNFLCGIVVQFDLTFSNKAWVEMERYHFIDIVSSESTIHRITKFDLDKAYNEYVDPRIVEIMKEKVNEYNSMIDIFPTDERKRKYLEILYSNPAGFRLTAGMTTNYRQLKTIYHQRKAHVLPEWREFCGWIKSLPMMDIVLNEF